MKTSQNKKKPVVQRNILASPYDKFWPLLDSDDSSALIELLKKLLPFAAIPKGFITSSKLRQIYREKDKTKRKELWKQRKVVLDASQIDIAKQNRKYLLLGVNSVTRGIENKKVAGCLISADVSPRLIVSHIITMAARSKIPVLVVPSLKETVKFSLGVPCLAFALHKCVVEEKNNFHALYEMIIRLGEKIIVPEHLCAFDHINDKINHVENNGSDSDSIIRDTTCTKSEIIKREVAMSQVCTDKEFTYIYRTGSNRRVYVPPKVDEKLEGTHLTFIPIESGYGEADIKYKNNYKSIKRKDDEENIHGDEEEEEEDDEDDLNEDVNFEFLPDSGSLFCIDTKGTSKNVECDVVKNSNSGAIKFRPTVVKKIKSNPNKRKRKMSQ